MVYVPGVGKVVAKGSGVVGTASVKDGVEVAIAIGIVVDCVPLLTVVVSVPHDTGLTVIVAPETEVDAMAALPSADVHAPE